MHKKSFMQGLKAGIPILLGYISVSFTFGIMAAAQGLYVWQAVLISMLNATSAGQLAGLNLMAVPGQYISMFISQLTINIRYSFMSVSLSQKTDEHFRGLSRWLLGFFVTDEIFAVAVSQDSVSREYFMGLSLLPYGGWILGTFLGAVLGNVLPDLIMHALCIGMYGMFVAIVIPPLKTDKPLRMIVLLAALLSCFFYYVFPTLSAGLTISLCAVAAAAWGAYKYPLVKKEENV